jgi:hypothetical protein
MVECESIQGRLTHQMRTLDNYTAIMMGQEKHQLKYLLSSWIQVILQISRKEVSLISRSIVSLTTQRRIRGHGVLAGRIEVKNEVLGSHRLSLLPSLTIMGNTWRQLLTLI